MGLTSSCCSTKSDRQEPQEIQTVALPTLPSSDMTSLQVPPSPHLEMTGPESASALRSPDVGVSPSTNNPLDNQHTAIVPNTLSSESPAYPRGQLPSAAKRIFSCGLHDLSGRSLDISPFATPCRYRFFSVEALRSHQRLDIYELEELGNTNYAAISYVWRGVPRDRVPPHLSLHPRDDLGMFAVCGAEDADPIGTNVLRDICNVPAVYDKQHEEHDFPWGVGPNGYMWLDRLCISQSSKADKAWQISQMHRIYKSCALCVILPGGLSRFVTVDEDTTWIERAWTLQEATLPLRSAVFFARNLTQSELDSRIGGPEEDVKGCVSYLLLSRILSRRPFGFGRLQSEALERTLPDGFGVRRSEHLRMSSIWKSSLMRTSLGQST
ncbi:hypothetical protein BOTBODRAFT_401213 [Botryobasidium botryosum FD-172 SS1]|uniref:Heterokaryon incompatibility domain-containing protein n=1 Tax=Botryobasidium botryosum (strain FD-172 SS1) TaxID=930990 RepID=A0A067MMD0_BOTB1|nr:hypothetical protein BOTBODRAFT_401213 [Botryobasidium botryosum FD-172 SS1]